VAHTLDFLDLKYRAHSSFITDSFTGKFLAHPVIFLSRAFSEVCHTKKVTIKNLENITIISM